MATGKRTSLAAKKQAVDALSVGDSLDLTARRFKVRPATLKKWQRELSRSQPGSPGANHKDAVSFLEMAEKAVIQDLTTRKRKRMSKAETYMLLALATLRD